MARRFYCWFRHRINFKCNIKYNLIMFLIQKFRQNAFYSLNPLSLLGYYSMTANNKKIVTYLELCNKVGKMEKELENIFTQLEDIWRELTALTEE